MAIIDEIIPQQGFETVTTRIGAILFEELTNQKTLQAFDWDFATYIERISPFDDSEDIMINVSCNNASYAHQNQSGSQGDTTFYIDVYANGVESQLATGDKDAMDKQNRFLGMIRYILSHTKYKTLLFVPPIIGGVNVQGFQKDENYGATMASFTKFARLTVMVRINESQSMWEQMPFTGMDTVIKLENTEKGYKLIFNT